MTNYKELLSRIVYCASADTCDGCPLDSDDTSEICVDRLLKKAADAIEQLCTDVERLEAENRAKEQYIAETISKVIKERDAAMADITHNCKSCMKKCVISDTFNRLHDGKCDEWVWRGVSKKMDKVRE